MFFTTLMIATVAGWVCIYLIGRRWLRTTDSERVETSAAPNVKAATARKVEDDSAECEIIPIDGWVSRGQISGSVKPEVAVEIASGLSELLGRPVRIRSVKKLPAPPTSGCAWARQGQVFIQTSHHLSQERRRA